MLFELQTEILRLRPPTGAEALVRAMLFGKEKFCTSRWRAPAPRTMLSIPSQAGAPVWVSFHSRQLIEQGLRVFQHRRIEALVEPMVDRTEQIAGFWPLSLVSP